MYNRTYKMKCEYCNKEVDKGNMNDIETENYKFCVCDSCMIIVEDKLLDLIKLGKRKDE